MSKKTFHLRLSLIAHYSLLITLLFSGCGARRVPNLERIFATARVREGKRPVIVVPGILGSQLTNRRTGEVVWPSLFRAVDDGLALPVGPDLANNRDELIAGQIIERARFARAIPEVYIYHQLLEALRNYGGYREGNWDNPSHDGDRDTFYVFAYDWRRDNVESARELVRRIEELKQRLNRPDLRFNIVAHSMGGLVARYAAMYGDADLPLDRVTPEPTWAGARAINKIFMFGTPNGGSAEAFASLIEGYSITEGLRRRVALLRKLSREDAITIPSLFQLLPHAHAARFLDENLEVISVDLYDPEMWRRYNWSAINDEDYRRRFTLGQTRGDDLPRRPGQLETLDSYFAAALNRARRFHEALNANAADSPVRLFIFGGDCEETLVAPVIVRDERRGRWITLLEPRSFRTSSREVSRTDAARRMFAPGDGRVTRQSLLGEGLPGRRASQLFNTPLPIAYGVFACDFHSNVQNNPILQNNALTVLINEVIN
jgi:pimeloyl-ACP methyl ester carboxylesterase